MKDVKKSKGMDLASTSEAFNGTAQKQIEPGEFLAAYDKFASGLFRFAWFKVGSKELAEDLVAQTFSQTWEYLQKGQSVAYWRVFLYQTLNNLIIDYYRRKKLEPILIDERDENKFLEFIDEKHLPAKLARRAEAGLILRAFHNLPSEQKDIMLWRYVDDLSIKEIAALTGKESSAIYVTIHRVLQKIKVNLKTKNELV